MMITTAAVLEEGLYGDCLAILDHTGFAVLREADVITRLHDHLYHIQSRLSKAGLAHLNEQRLSLVQVTSRYIRNAVDFFTESLPSFPS